MLFSSINQSVHPELVPLDLIRPECILVHTLFTCSDRYKERQRGRFEPVLTNQPYLGVY